MDEEQSETTLPALQGCEAGEKKFAMIVRRWRTQLVDTSTDPVPAATRFNTVRGEILEPIG